MVRRMLRELSSRISRFAASYVLAYAPSPRNGLIRLAISDAVAYLRKIRFAIIRSSSGKVFGSTLTIGWIGSWLMRFTGTMRYMSPTFTIASPLTRRIVSSSGTQSTGFDFAVGENGNRAAHRRVQNVTDLEALGQQVDHLWSSWHSA